MEDVKIKKGQHDVRCRVEQGFAAVAVVPKGQLAEEEEEEEGVRQDGWGGGKCFRIRCEFFSEPVCRVIAVKPAMVSVLVCYLPALWPGVSRLLLAIFCRFSPDVF